MNAGVVLSLREARDTLMPSSEDEDTHLSKLQRVAPAGSLPHGAGQELCTTMMEG